MANQSSAAAARARNRPAWFDKILHGYRREVRHPHLQNLNHEQRDQKNWDTKTTKVMSAERKRWKAGKDGLWPNIERIGLDEGRFSELASACWSYGFSRISRRLHIEAETSATEKENRRLLTKAAKDARKLAKVLETLSLDKGVWLLLSHPKSGRVHVPLKLVRGPKSGELLVRRRGLKRRLIACAESIETCLTPRETQAKMCKIITENALLGAVGEDGKPVGIRGIRELLVGDNDSVHSVHWAVGASMVNLFHPNPKVSVSGDGLLRDYKVAKEQRRKRNQPKTA